MEARVKAREWSLNEPVGPDRDMTSLDLLQDLSSDQETQLIEQETGAALSNVTQKALKKLNPRERFIIEKRYLIDSAWTLQKLGDYFGTSRERIRQLEKRALGKLRQEFSPQLLEGIASA
jgi:RNA polymerase sigma-32 factor